jgi:tetratricopeptide (TPR) repeat protein
MGRILRGLLTIGILWAAIDSAAPIGRADFVFEPEKSAAAETPEFKTLYQDAATAILDEEWDRALALTDRALAKAPGDVKFLMIRAKAFDGKNDLLKALADVNRIIELNPKQALAYRARASLYNDCHRIHDMLADAQRALDLEPNNPMAHLQMGSAYLASIMIAKGPDQKALTAKARAAFDEALRLNEACLDAYGYRAILLAQDGEFELAREDLERIEQLDPNESRIGYFRAMYLIHTKQPEQAWEILKLLTLSSNSREQADGRHGLVAYYSHVEKNIEKAVEQISDCLERRPNAYYRLTRAGVYAQKGEYSKAEKDIAEYLRLNPRGSKDLFLMRAQCRAQGSGRVADAIADLTEALKLEPDFATACASRGWLHLLLGHYEEGAADFTHAVRLDPKASLYRRMLGVCRQEMGRYEEAVADLTKAIDIDPQSANAAFAHRNRGVCLTCLKRHEEAAADFKEAIRLKSDDYHFLYPLAYAHYEQGQCIALLSNSSRLARKSRPGEIRRRNSAPKIGLRAKPALRGRANHSGPTTAERGESVLSRRPASVPHPIGPARGRCRRGRQARRVGRPSFHELHRADGRQRELREKGSRAPNQALESALVRRMAAAQPR